MVEPRYSVLQSLFADRVFRIPHYQRFYSWQKRQRDDLFSDLKKISQNQTDQHHFMATIVCHRTAETKEVGTAQYRLYDVVDGQQRLTTLILLLKCIELLLPDSEDRAELAKILVKRDGHLILLQTNNLNADIFNRFIREGMQPNLADLQTHSDRNLMHAIQECKKFVHEWNEYRGALNLMRIILHRLGFVVYDTEDPRIVYTIFEVLNSRGLVVDWLDKTKSFLMGKLFELAASTAVAEAELNSVQSLWSEIYREIAKINVPGEEILRITASLYYGPGQGKPRSADESLEQTKLECKGVHDPVNISRRLLQIAKSLVQLYLKGFDETVTEILQSRILAIAIMSATGVNEEEREMLLKQWERVTFRIFGLFDKDSRTKVGDYVRLGHKIMTQDLKFRTYNQIMSGLKTLGGEYPIDRALNEGIKGKDCYERPEMSRYLLWSYEEHLADEAGAGATIDPQESARIWQEQAADTLEHIFPQNPSVGSDWNTKMHDSTGVPQPLNPNVGRIGNLLLLPKKLNSEAQAYPFPKKKEIYIRHHLRMVDEVCKIEDWTLKEIQEREDRICTWAKERWSDI
jgi:hypothetical protein